MGGPCKNSSWINFCQLWLKCVVLDVSDTIVLRFILLLASLAPATINPTMVRQELQVTVARVTVVRSERHHYSSSPATPSAAARSGVGKAVGGRRKEEESSLGDAGFQAAVGEPGICIICWALGFVVFFTFAKKKKNQPTKKTNKPSARK